MSAPDSDELSVCAAAFRVDESFIEKDWHVIQALAVIQAIEYESFQPIFSGGTSLAKGYRLIERFSEDIDFKVISPNPSRLKFRAYRALVIERLVASGYELTAEPIIGSGSRYFQAEFNYGPTLQIAPGLRPRIKLEMTFLAPSLPAIACPLVSMVSEVRRSPPEITAMMCVDPIETAADKISALAWRTLIRDREDERDDPTVVRHLHDLAALSERVKREPVFKSLALQTAQNDLVGRAHRNDIGATEMLQAMLPTMAADPLWAQEYSQFVGNVSYASNIIEYDQAIASNEELVRVVTE